MNYSNKTKFLISMSVFVVASLAVIALPATTNACYNTDCGYSYNYRPYEYNITYSRVAQVHQSPVVIQQPVYVQQPVYIQQPVIQPVYVQQPVIQQPIIVQQPVIQQPIYTQPTIYRQSNNYNLDIGCYTDPTNSKVNQPITWNVEVVGGIGPYTYSWTGSDGLTGSQSSVIKYYSTPGSKSAIVTVTSADGRTGTRACSNTLEVTSAYTYKAPVKTYSAPAAPVTHQEQNSNVDQSAASLFSLSNVPWGWVAILIILVLFITVMYLLLNRQKI